MPHGPALNCPRPLLAVVVALVMSGPLRADSEEPRLPQPPFPPYGWRQIKYDAKYLGYRATHWTRDDLKTAGLVAGGTLGLYAIRDEVRDHIQEHRDPDRSEFLSDVRNMGNGTTSAAVALTAWLASYATDNPREKETALLIVESAAYSSLVTGVGQFVLAAERPRDGDDVDFFRTGGHGVSLDVALAAALVPPLRRQYLRVDSDDGTGLKAWKWTASTLLYTGVALTAWQRMDSDAHWLPDVALGAATGLSVGAAVGRAHDRAQGIDRARREGRVRFAVGGDQVACVIRLGR